MASQIMEKLPEAAVAFDRRGYVTYMNRAAEKLLGFDSSGELHSSRLFLPGSESEDVVSFPARVKAVEKEAVVVSRSKSRIPVLVRMARVSCPGLDAVAFLKPTAARRAEQHRRIDRLASIGELAAGVAHEIRNPLAGIGTSAQVLRSRFAKDDERVKFADVILDEVDRLEKIIENLLLFARPKQPQLVKHDMRDSVERTLNLVREQAEKQEVKVQNRSEDELPEVYVDPGQMSQVLLNLILNALHAMPSGGKLALELKVVRKRMPASGGRRKTDVKPAGPARAVKFVRVAVSDTGHGIPKQNLSKLFTPFFTTRSGGTGLGLSISQAIVREHGGSISVSSREGRGTKVTIDIPVEKRHGERR
ncbi:MAG: PAS domain-containing protein [Candidatus Eiseniibacteriota bacterium]|nr:MAG: PAS domain-containing protein [Candidatus Eisenbacteria bacterium]